MSCEVVRVVDPGDVLRSRVQMHLEVVRIASGELDPGLPTCWRVDAAVAIPVVDEFAEHSAPVARGLHPVAEGVVEVPELRASESDSELVVVLGHLARHKAYAARLAERDVASGLREGAARRLNQSLYVWHEGQPVEPHVVGDDDQHVGPRVGAAGGEERARAHEADTEQCKSADRLPPGQQAGEEAVDDLSLGCESLGAQNAHGPAPASRWT